MNKMKTLLEEFFSPFSPLFVLITVCSYTPLALKMFHFNILFTKLSPH